VQRLPTSGLHGNAGNMAPELFVMTTNIRRTG
jgi:hypothetical protein